ncbi:hypothetical protein ACTWQE_34115, partial [Streptomyces sp. 8N706]
MSDQPHSPYDPYDPYDSQDPRGPYDPRHAYAPYDPYGHQAPRGPEGLRRGPAHPEGGYGEGPYQQPPAPGAADTAYRPPVQAPGALPPEQPAGHT